MVSYLIKRGRKAWYYQLPLPGATKQNRLRERKFFSTKREAEAAEAQARIAINRAACLSNVAIAPPTLDLLLEKYFSLHCCGPEKPLAGKTVERYRDFKIYLSPELLALAPAQITRLQLTAEWKRLLQNGGRTRRDKTPRPLSPKTVAHIANMVSAAYNWGGQEESWSENINPVKFSKRPKPKKREAVALQPGTAMQVLMAEGGFWCRDTYLHAADALGCRRGELCALRWSDYRNGQFRVARSLTQYRDEHGQEQLEFKPTKGDEVHYVTVPDDLLAALEDHRAKQREFMRQFGADYCRDKDDEDLIFANEHGSKLRPDSVSSSISALCRALGLPKGASLHSLRHTHASALLESGVPPEVVSKRLGHASIRTTLEIYSHVINRNADRKAAEAYDYYRQKRAEQGAKHAERVQ
jgi:integrase